MIDNLDELRREAETMGLAHLTDEHLRQFAKARASAERLIEGIPRDLHMYDEPAHTFSAEKEG